MPPRPPPSRIAAALDYLQRLKSGVGEFVGGVGTNLADRARSAGGLAYETLTTDPNIGRMTTAEFSQAAADRAPTPRLDQAARDIGTIGRAIVTQPVETGKAIVGGEIQRARQAMTSPQAAGEYAGSFLNPMRLAAALRHRVPISELDVYHGTPHTYAPTEANPLGEFDASKIGTGEGAQAYGHGIYYAENPDVARSYKTAGVDKNDPAFVSTARQYAQDPLFGETLAEKLATLRRDPNDRFGQMAADYLEKNYDTLRNQGGSLYKADLPDEMIDRMLDWDKPLSEQSAIAPMLDALQVSPELPKGFGQAIVAARTRKHFDGNDLFAELVKVMPKEQVSETLKRAGIPGIKYLDAGSRGQGGSGTRNFVVFPGEEKKVKILERNGKKVAEMLQRTNPSTAQVEVDIYPLRSDSNTLYLSKIAVPEGQRGQGLGTKAMQDVIARADAEGKRVVLSPSTEYGATSVGRLKDFYKRFGFVENKGRNKNYAISETMYRDPQKQK